MSDAWFRRLRRSIPVLSLLVALELTTNLIRRGEYDTPIYYVALVGPFAFGWFFGGLLIGWLERRRPGHEQDPRTIGWLGPTRAVPASWQPDPSGRHEWRYWDGTRWTDHVASNGVQALESSESA